MHDACGGVFEAEEMADLVGDHVGEKHGRPYAVTGRGLLDAGPEDIGEEVPFSQAEGGSERPLSAGRGIRDDPDVDFAFGQGLAVALAGLDAANRPLGGDPALTKYLGGKPLRVAGGTPALSRTRIRRMGELARAASVRWSCARAVPDPTPLIPQMHAAAHHKSPIFKQYS